MDTTIGIIALVFLVTGTIGIWLMAWQATAKGIKSFSVWREQRKHRAP